MNLTCTLQLFQDGAWHDAGTVTLFGAEDEGWRARSYVGYSVEWAVEHAGAVDAHAFSCRFKVGLRAKEPPHWPVFLIDMLPQGYGRSELLKRLSLPETMGAAADWQLLMAGAGNPIGNIRVKEAAQWLTEQGEHTRGFTFEEIAERSDQFTEFLAQHGLFIAGSSGVQGEWPKVLLTQAKDGLLYLDHTVPDELARRHFIVKFGRGTNEQLATILRHEATYMEFAKLLGLRVHDSLTLLNRALFIPRFDRKVVASQVVRFGQESIATLTECAGFGTVPSHEEVCKQLILRCTDPAAEVLEYLKRDVANIALANRDNHARNTAIQRDFKGNVRLTPLYDFVPMYLHPDGIARRIRWESIPDNGSPDWAEVITAVSKLDHSLQRDALVSGLKEMIPAIHQIIEHGEQLGLEPEVHRYIRPWVQAQLHQLQNLR